MKFAKRKDYLNETAELLLISFEELLSSSITEKELFEELYRHETKKPEFEYSKALGHQRELFVVNKARNYVQVNFKSGIKEEDSFLVKKYLKPFKNNLLFIKTPEKVKSQEFRFKSVNH